MHVSDIVTVSS